ncbi:MAG: hypothetical protein BGO69_17320 [Bacteroidetes bacterium 46-16]|nr:MAG: hypothetical protein BGO69_17320 [Bacteroidetes bacterium 46-16]
MKTGKYTTAILGLIMAGVSFTSCVRNDYYNTEPGHNHNTGYQNEFYDDFSSDRYNWSYGSPQDSAYANVQNGQLQFVNYALAGLQTAVVSTGANFNGDFSVSAKIKSDHRMGIIFGASNSDYGYSFTLDDSGSFLLYKEGSPSLLGSAIINWTSSSAITMGAWNILKVEQSGNYWTGTINGIQVFQVAAQPISGSQCGFILLPNTVGYADDLDVKW